MLAKSPISRSPDSEAGDHAVRFYDADEELVEEVADFLDGALRAGGLAVAIATPEHRGELSRRLCGFGGPMLDSSSDWFTGSLILLDADLTLGKFMVDGRPDARLFEATIAPLLEQAPAGKPIHAFGEMVALLCERGDYEGALLLEGLWNDLARKHRFSLFCAYADSLFTTPEGARAYQHVCASHTRVLTELLKSAAADHSNGPLAGEASLRQHAIELQSEIERRKQAERTLRQRERELAAFLDNASEGIHKVAADGTILYANRAELELLGYRWEEYVGRSIAEFYVDQEQIRGILAKLQRGEVLRDEPALMRCKDGSHKPVVIYSNGHFEQGELKYTRCFTRDASERVARELLLESLREASRAKDEFLAMLGHELRNPLSPIVMALRLLRMRGEHGASRELGIIERQVDHMVRLVDDLLDISRITRGKIDLKREQVDLPAVLMKAVEQVNLLLEQRSHRLHVDVEPGLRCEGDPTRLAQVVANLLTNAARYTDSGGDIRLRAWREGDGQVAVSVRDNGRGISAEMLPRVFELFYQGQRGVDRSDGGLGVGLALVRSLVELHGGTVHAASDGPGRGSEFTIRLPWTATAGQDREVEPPPVAAVRGSGRRVLVVDDNPDAAETLAEWLASQGHEVAAFTDPVTALQELAQLRPQVAILDIGLPVMDGYELGSKVREVVGPECTLIALTGYGQEADRERSRAARFDHHLVKPVAPEAVLGLLEPDARLTEN
jgi:PAS domain S-box-containing protein